MSGRAWRLGRFFGINVYIDSSWIFIFLLVAWTLAVGYFPRSNPRWEQSTYWALGLATSLLFFLSVLVHEFCHSLVARAFGEKVDRITLFLFGGAAQMSAEPKTPKAEFLMTLAGPFSSFALAALFGVLWALSRPLSPAAAAVFYYLSIINVGLGLFNLLPGFPLDGGRLLRSAIWAATGNLKLATKAASTVGQAVAFLLVMAGLLRLFTGSFLDGLWLMFIGWFLRNAAISSYRQLILREVMAEVYASQLMNRDFAPVSPDLTLSELVDRYIIQRHDHAYPVLEGGSLVGIICLHDVRKVPRDHWPTVTVRQVMTPAPDLQVVRTTDDGNTILARMAAKDVHQLPVLEDGRLVGMVSRNDVVRFLQWQTELGLYA
jgi:Zn-dependent protease/predicted transcriptional regulator